MSKYVKDLMTDHLRQKLEGVEEALLVNMVGLDANSNTRLRAALASKDINVMVVKNSLARRATEGTSLAAMFQGLDGTAAVCWGAEDIVALAKEVIRISKDDGYEAFSARGGVLDGEALTAEEVEAVSKWPSREEQLSILMGQVLSPGATLSGQLLAGGAKLASQIEQLAEKDEAEAA
jgi:large subunit ribosomal protein L10